MSVVTLERGAASSCGLRSLPPRPCRSRSGLAPEAGVDVSSRFSPRPLVLPRLAAMRDDDPLCSSSSPELSPRALTHVQPWISSPGVRLDAISRWARASCAPPSATVCVHSWTSLARHPCPRDAISPISFRPRGFSPPRRFAPHMGCRLEACCRPWGSPCFTRSHDVLRVVWIVILAALHPPEDIPPHQHRHGHPW